MKSAVYFDNKGPNGKMSGIEVILTDQDNICQMLQAGKQPKGMTAFGLAAMTLDSSGNAVVPTPGEHTVFDPTTSPGSAGNDAIAVFEHLDSSCTNTLTDTSAIANSGSFDVMMGSQKDHVTGSFDAQFCSFDPNASVSCGQGRVAGCVGADRAARLVR